MNSKLFASFFLGGFECATHYRSPRDRLDLIAATQHDKHVKADYARLREHGIFTARDGVRWHLIERAPGRYNFSSLLPMLHAARELNIQVIYDLCHYGWPDDIDLFSPAFVRRFADFARAAADVIANETGAAPFLVPINEISFWAWAGGEVGYLSPFECARGLEVKFQLVRAAIAGIDAIWAVQPSARIVHVEPVINVIPDAANPDPEGAEAQRLSMFQAWEMLRGTAFPELGGRPEYLDVLGVNFYPHNQWLYPSREMVPRSDPAYRPMSDLLQETYERYGRPLFISETGAEDDGRPGWLRYVGEQVRAALRQGIPVEGICLYPIVNSPGWIDSRHCHNGLWDYANARGERPLCQPMADELRRQIEWMESEPRPLRRNGAEEKGAEGNRSVIAAFLTKGEGEIDGETNRSEMGAP